MKRIGLPLAALFYHPQSHPHRLRRSQRGRPRGDLAENGGVTEEQADCIAKAVFDSDLNEDQIDALGSDAENIEDTDLSDEEEAELLEVFSEATTKCITIE